MAPAAGVTVVIPAHNRSNWLERAVRSVLAQTTPDFELVVVDDGSTECLAKVRELVVSSGHQFLRQSRLGPASARNRGVAAGSAPWIAFLDSDDFWRPEKLATQLAYHAGRSDCQISQTAETWIRREREVRQPKIYQHAAGNIFSQCLKRCCLSCSSVLLSRQCFRSVGGFDRRYAVCEDYDLWLRLTHRHAVGWIPQELTVKHGGHADQLSKAFPALDRFRLHSLFSAWIRLPAQRMEIESEIATKAGTLAQGAEKRGRSTSLYSDCLQWLRNPSGMARSTAPHLQERLLADMQVDASIR